MILFKDVISIHRILIEQFVGRQRFRDETLLESAIARPHFTFDGKDLYPSSILLSINIAPESRLDDAPHDLR